MLKSTIYKLYVLSHLQANGKVSLGMMIHMQNLAIKRYQEYLEDGRWVIVEPVKEIESTTP